MSFLKKLLVALLFCSFFGALGVGGAYYLTKRPDPVKLDKTAVFTGDLKARDLKLDKREIRLLNSSIDNCRDVVEKVAIRLDSVGKNDPFYSKGGFRFRLNLRAKSGADFQSRERYARRSGLVADMAEAIDAESNALRAVMSNPAYKGKTPRRILHSSS